MSLPSRISLGLMAALALAGCKREAREYRGQALLATNRSASYGGNAYHLAQGQRLYLWMNCAGCHSNGGGGMGPPLMDDEWRYGGSLPQIVATIMNGRPNGMPSFRKKITEDQAWQIATYVRSMSGRMRQDALAGRADKPSSVEPPTLQSRQPVKRVTPQQDDASEEQ